MTDKERILSTISIVLVAGCAAAAGANFAYGNNVIGCILTIAGLFNMSMVLMDVWGTDL